MSERSVWWIRNATEDGKDVLIFDPGYDSGDLHVYVHKKSIPAKEIEAKAKKQFGQGRERSLLAKDLARLEFDTTSVMRYQITD